MKNFIEVIRNERGDRELININKIIVVDEKVGVDNKTIIVVEGGEWIKVNNTYQEIKDLIKKAQE